MQDKHFTQILLSFVLISTLGYSVNTYATHERHIVVAPQCLITKLSTHYKTLSVVDSLYLIEINDAGIEELMIAKSNQKELCGGFMDVTPEWDKLKSKTPSSPKNAKSFLNEYAKPTQKSVTSDTIKYKIQYPNQVHQLINQLNPSNMWSNLSTLSNFQDRFANSDYGIQAANWIKSQVEAIAASQGRTDVHVYTISTGNYKQPSVIAKIGDSTEPGIVIGAHMDTLSSQWSRVHLPGADDDGTGSVTVLETTRTLLSSGMHFKKPIYVIWYAAEEEGLVGSYYVVNEFSKKNIPIDAVIHFDMTGYAYHNEPTLWLIQDYINKPLTSYLETLITTYVKQPVKYTACGYACSDHASWTKGGYASAMSAEAKFENTNPNLHSEQDSMDKISFNHMTDYLKLSAAFAVEMAEPIG